MALISPRTKDFETQQSTTIGNIAILPHLAITIIVNSQILSLRELFTLCCVSKSFGLVIDQSEAAEAYFAKYAIEKGLAICTSHRDSKSWRRNITSCRGFIRENPPSLESLSFESEILQCLMEVSEISTNF